NYNSLMGSNIILNLLNYSDRILIGLVIGTRYVPLFFIATIVGKLSNLVINPLATVLLSYEVDNNNTYSRKKYIRIFFITIILSMILSVIISLISYMVIKILYPNYLDDVKSLIF